ncbi:O-antigen ligase [Humitalea rosea]|uniref:O-antigen ligase n=1 Tax=Humitalea rosea TaxID=990373 RepID=A0A2W7I2A0_9PROT|nr:O-antigen ligase family protein [Humitalea rosea]PZW40418.1 O-antigen ligase [Humitalea rosea]
MPLIHLSATGQGQIAEPPARLKVVLAPTPGPMSQAFTVFGALFYSAAILVLDSAGAPDDVDLGAFDPLNTLFHAIILTGSAIYALRHWRRILGLLAGTAPFLLLLGFTLASVLWSQSFEHTLRRSIGFGALIVFTLYAYDRHGLRGFMRLALLGALLGAGASLLEVLLRPTIGFDTGEYANAVRGIYGVKNSFGAALLDGMLAMSFLLLHQVRVRLRDIAIILFLLAMLVLSRSTTSLLLSMAVAGVTLGILLIRRGGGWLGVLMLAASLGFGLATIGFGFFGLEGIFELIGKDQTLTGRVFIWQAVHRMIDERPWLGWGFSAFWIQGARPAEQIWQDLQWLVPHAHNAFLDIALQLGWIGVTLIALVACATLLRVLRALGGPKRQVAIWGLIFLITATLYGYGEAAIYRVNLTMVLWIMLWLDLAPIRSGGDRLHAGIRTAGRMA